MNELSSRGFSPEREFVQALFDFETFPGRYAIALREPRVLFDRSSEVLALASGREVGWLSSDDAAKSGLRKAACFFVRTGMLRQGADAYTVLGVPRGFDPVALRDNYRILIRLTHPDFMMADAAGWPSDAATRINTAHDTLSSPEKKRNYDASLKPLIAQAAGSAFRSTPIPIVRTRQSLFVGTWFWLVKVSKNMRNASHGPRRISAFSVATFSVIAAVGAFALTYWFLAEDEQQLVANADLARPARLTLERNLSDPSLQTILPLPRPLYAEQARLVPAVPQLQPQALAMEERSGAVRPAIRSSNTELVPSSRVAVSAVPGIVGFAEPGEAVTTQPPAVHVAAPALLPQPAATVVTAMGPIAPAPPVNAAQASVAQSNLPMPVVVESTSAVGPAPASVSRISVADVQPLLTALIGALQTGRSDDAFRSAEPSVRRGDGPEFMQAFHRARNGARMLGVGQVSFRGTPTAGQLIVDGTIQLYMQDDNQRTIARDIHIRAHFSSRDGSPVLTRLSLADARS